jgi:membrane-bound lytic murein transglycosylase D
VIPVPKGTERYAAIAASSTAAEVPAPVSRPARKRIDRVKVTRALAQARPEPVDREGKVALTYRVKKGDTIGHIAEWFQCRATDIRNWNDIPYGRPILAGQRLEIWVDKDQEERFEKLASSSFEEKQKNVRPVAASEPVDATTEGSMRYKVQRGDNLDKIARDHSVSIAQLKRWNNLRSTRISVGQELVILTDAQHIALQQEKPSGENGEVILHIVKKGETLWEIARAYDTEPSTLKAFNDITRNKIYAGQELKIPAGKQATNQ